MYCAGNMPDHVTRYNHRNESRWMVPARSPRQISINGVMTALTCAISCAGLIVAAVFMAQMA